MAEATCEILNLNLAEDERTARFDLPPGMLPAPGQYLHAYGIEKDEFLPTALFLTERSDRGCTLCGDIPASWAPGDQIALRGPLGQGFHLPGNARRVGIVPLHGYITKLLPIVRAALAQKAAVSLFSQRMPASLPSEVEALPLDGLAEGWSWADYVALEVDFTQLGSLRELLRLDHLARPACLAEILVAGSYPCAGTAECGVCAVKTGNRYRLACKDGPVFELNSLDY